MSEEALNNEENLHLNWMRQDVERRFGFPGGRFTQVGTAFSLLLALLPTIAIFTVMAVWVHPNESLRFISSLFLERGPVPYPITFLFIWGWVILAVKARKIQYQRRALDLAAVPQQPEFVLNRKSSRVVLERIHSLVDNTSHFVLLNRIERALSNLKNVGQISDVSTILSSQAQDDEETCAASYNLVRGFIWAIPVLGFIGTVMGLGQALGAFGEALQESADMGQLKNTLRSVTAGLSTAFDTTFLGLVASLLLQMRLVFLQQNEHGLLDDCGEYCHNYVVSKLKLSDREDES